MLSFDNRPSRSGKKKPQHKFRFVIFLNIAEHVLERATTRNFAL